jgi:hypothetical protein
MSAQYLLAGFRGCFKQMDVDTVAMVAGNSRI